MVHARFGELQTVEEISLPQQDKQVTICQLFFLFSTERFTDLGKLKLQMVVWF